MDKITETIKVMLENKAMKFMVILLVSLILAYIGKFILRRILKPLTKKTKTKVDDLIVKSVSSIIFYIVLLVGLRTGLHIFEFKTTTMFSAVDSFLILIVAVLMINIIDNFANHWMKEWKSKTKTTADERLIPFLQKIFKSIIIVLALLFIFNAWKINISPLLATAGIAGLAIGLAVKDSLNNILGGLQLVLDRVFKVGDKVKLESGELGTIMDIGLRSTKLRTYDNETIFIPNGYLANAKIKNYTQPDFSIRVNVNFGVAYGTDIQKVISVVKDALATIEIAMKDPPPSVDFLKMSDFSLDFVGRVWVNDYSEAWGTQLLATEVIYNALNKSGINIPFPTHTVYSKKVD